MDQNQDNGGDEGSGKIVEVIWIGGALAFVFFGVPFLGSALFAGLYAWQYFYPGWLNGFTAVGLVLFLAMVLAAGLWAMVGQRARPPV